MGDLSWKEMIGLGVAGNYEDERVFRILPREAMAHNDRSIRRDGAERISEKKKGPLEDIANWLAITRRPSQALISIGATRYTDYSETTFLEVGNQSIVAGYDGQRYDEATIRQIVRSEEGTTAPDLSLLRQEVV